MFGRLAAVLSVLLVVVACSSGGRADQGPPTFPGLSSLGPPLAVPVPTGIAGLSGSTSARASATTSASAAATPTSEVATAGGHGAPAPARASSAAGVPRTSTPLSSSAASPPRSGPHVSVNPANGLRGGQRVLVVATALPADTSVKIFECRTDAGCTLLTPLDRITTDSAGRTSRTVTVASRVGIQPCGTGCDISVRPAVGSGASAPIGFV